jgi:hypothetical protein
MGGGTENIGDENSQWDMRVDERHVLKINLRDEAPAILLRLLRNLVTWPEGSNVW